jgi:ADP-heptose:LPS heptosyltransferase/predicted SAM-dependent methyltransferase
MVWKKDDSAPNETAKIRWDLVEYTRGMGLDLGCGNNKAFPHFIGVDNCVDEVLFGNKITPDFRVQTVERLPMWASESMNFVFSSHLLEHIANYEAALKEWWRVIKVGGHLCLYLPHKNFYPNIGEDGANPDHKHDFLPSDIIAAMKGLAKHGGWDLLRNEERNEGDEYSFFQVYRKLNTNKFRFSCNDPKPAKTCAVIRYGAFGDLLMASSIFPGLKAQGYHITLYSVPRGYEVVKHDPHIDKVILQDTDQVPNHLLSVFWAHVAKQYDKFVNLSESVESTFLTTKDKAPYTWPHALRHKFLNHNYLEFAHELAGVPFPPRQKFYANEAEKAWAAKERKKIGGSPLVLYSLSGSSVNKVWPHLDALLARMMVAYPESKVVLLGDEQCKMLEAGWQNEPRVLKRSGVWSIRESLSMIAQADLVVGPETGVLNAAAFDQVPKVVTLSHSSVENLTRDWVNTISLVPNNTDCYPCHTLHFGFDTCRRDEKLGASACQTDISIDQMWDAVRQSLGTSLEKAA